MPDSDAPADHAPLRSVGEDKKATEHLANERTFLAWVRTSISVISLGFVVAKFGVWLARLQGELPARTYEAGAGWSMPIGTGMMAVGAALCLLAAWHYRRTSHDIERGSVRPSFRLIAFVAALVTLLAVIMIGYLLLSAR